ncbi:hypothetical protein DH2020_025862 [Rehmannia glutinosa]|uniref:Pectinesterase inhibitor domain-containing protein n=1 Tax=Rehmannia glutinosa TaxID=99300 RepID=A0ABR0VZF9_REHGL
MAGNQVNLLLIISIALLTMAPILHQANAAVDVANKWCRRTTHSATCLSIVEADRRAHLKHSPNGIATILTDKALATAAAISIKIAKLLETATNRHEVAALKSCFAGYSGAITSLRSAYFKVINRQTYSSLVADISDANDEPRDCELTFQEPPAVRSPITAENERLRDICDTTLEIINLVVCKSSSFC